MSVIYDHTPLNKTREQGTLFRCLAPTGTKGNYT